MDSKNIEAVPWQHFQDENIEPFPGAGFTFADDRWNLAKWKTKAVKPSGYFLNFNNIPSWLKKSIKRYIAWGWLSQDYSLGWCQEKLTCIRKLTEYIDIYRQGEITQLIELSGSDEGFVLYLQEAISNPDRVNEIANSLSEFTKWLRKRHQPSLSFRPHLYIAKKLDTLCLQIGDVLLTSLFYK